MKCDFHLFFRTRNLFGKLSLGLHICCTVIRLSAKKLRKHMMQFVNCSAKSYERRTILAVALLAKGIELVQDVKALC